MARKKLTLTKTEPKPRTRTKPEPTPVAEGGGIVRVEDPVMVPDDQAHAHPDPKDVDFLVDFLKKVEAREEPFGNHGSLYRFGKPKDRQRLVMEESGRVLYQRLHQKDVVVEGPEDLPAA